MKASFQEIMMKLMIPMDHDNETSESCVVKFTLCSNARYGLNFLDHWVTLCQVQKPLICAVLQVVCWYLSYRASSGQVSLAAEINHEINHEINLRTVLGATANMYSFLKNVNTLNLSYFQWSWPDCILWTKCLYFNLNSILKYEVIRLNQTMILDIWSNLFKKSGFLF